MSVELSDSADLSGSERQWSDKLTSVQCRFPLSDTVPQNVEQGNRSEAVCNAEVFFIFSPHVFLWEAEPSAGIKRYCLLFTKTFSPLNTSKHWDFPLKYYPQTYLLPNGGLSEVTFFIMCWRLCELTAENSFIYHFGFLDTLVKHLINDKLSNIDPLLFYFWSVNEFAEINEGPHGRGQHWN